MSLMRTFRLLVLTTGLLAGSTGAAMAAGEAATPPDQDWPFEGILGQYDYVSAQRGYKVYEQVCASCHSMDHLDYRHLEGIGFTEAEVRAIAANQQVMDGPNDQGEMFRRAARPSDDFAKPYANAEAAAAANGGVMPPDLSVIVQARGGGADYIYGLLVGYEEPPADETLAAGQHWNRYYPGNVIAMAQPLYEGSVTYDDGAPETVAQYSWDLTNFLAWASEPHMETRKRMGIQVILFLTVLAGILYALKRRIWKGVDH
jgi:ubiquinol-cytochrome c reductase cytochrome c1 subunit